LMAPAGTPADIIEKLSAEIARALNQDPWDVFFAIARTGAFAMPQSMSEANKIKAMQQDFISFDTDAGPAPSPERGDQSRQDGATRSGAVSHPRAFGAFPRVLARYVGLYDFRFPENPTVSSTWPVTMSEPSRSSVGPRSPPVKSALCSRASKPFNTEPRPLPAGVQSRD